MKLVFLGTSCAIPTADNGFTSFLVDTGSLLVLVDASGNPVQSIHKTGRDPLELDLVVLTHCHADHIAGYPSLLQTLSCMGRKRELGVVCSVTTRSVLEKLHRLLELNPPNNTFPLRIGESFDRDELEILLFPGNHSVPTSMVSFRSPASRFFYTSDTAFNPAVSEAARGSQTLIHEATFSHRWLGEPGHEGHSSAYQAGLSADRAGVARLFLCHICWHKYVNTEAIAVEAASAFHGEVILPQPFRWYSL
jgi:ribonuclease Z